MWQIFDLQWLLGGERPDEEWPSTVKQGLGFDSAKPCCFFPLPVSLEKAHICDSNSDLHALALSPVTAH